MIREINPKIIRLKRIKTDLINTNCKIPEEVIERSRIYRSSEFEEYHGVWDCWCDGYQNKGHFFGIDVVSIMAKSVEVRLCKDCRDALFNSETSGLCPTVRYPQDFIQLIVGKLKGLLK